MTRRFAAVGMATFLLAAASVASAQPAFRNGDVFAAGGDGKIRRFDSSGRLIQVIDDGLQGHKTGMCFDAQGHLYATDFDARTMSKFDNRGRLVKRGWGGTFNQPESCVIDSQGFLYSGEVYGNPNMIRKFDLQGGPLGRFAPDIEGKGVDWIDLAADRCTILYTCEGAGIKRYDVCQGRQLPDFARGLQAPCFALRIRDNGEVMVACHQRAYRLSPSGSVMRTYPLPGESQFAMNLDPDGISFWTGGIHTGNVYRINIETGAGGSSPVFQARIRGSRENLLERLLNLGDQRVAVLGGLAVFGEPTAAVVPAPPEPPSAALPPAVPPPPAEDVPRQPEPKPVPEPPQPEPPASSLEFGPAAQIAFEEAGSRGESAGRLDLSAAHVEGSPVIRARTNLDLRGVTLQIETAGGWVQLGSQPVPLAYSPGSALQWPLRLQVGDCPAAHPSEPPFILLESTGKGGRTARLQIPLSIRIRPDPWLHCWWPLLAAVSAALLTGVIAYGFISPSRFAPRIGVVLSQEEDMAEGFFHAIRAQRGSRSGLYRDARIYIHPNFRLSGKAAGALARLRAGNSQVRIQPQPGVSVQRRTIDDQWEALPSGESPARMGTVYRDEMGTIFFELRTG